MRDSAAEWRRGWCGGGARRQTTPQMAATVSYLHVRHVLACVVGDALIVTARAQDAARGGTAREAIRDAQEHQRA